MEFVRALKLLRRQVYGLRAFVPGMRRHHKLESMVGPLGFWSELQAYQIGAVKKLGLRPDQRLLDLGCGPLQGGEAFIRYLDAGNYVGIDHRRSVIEVGREQVERCGLGPKRPALFVSDSFGEAELGDRTFDFVWASQVLYYFDVPMMNRLFAMLQERLRPGGRLCGDILAVDADRTFLRAPLPPVHTPESLGAIARAHGLNVKGRGPILDFGYPRRLGLRTNILIEVARLS